MRLLGVDPGVSGAIACYDTEFSALVVRDFPTAKSRQKRTVLLESPLVKLIRDLAPDAAVIESVHALPRQGVASTFSFGLSFGILRGVLSALEIPVNFLTPQEWRRVARVPGRGGDKDASRIRASELYPANSHSFSRVKDHGRADAALIVHAFILLDGLRPVMHDRIKTGTDTQPCNRRYGPTKGKAFAG